MPKVTSSQKQRKQAFSSMQPTTKNVRFMFEGEQKIVAINLHDSTEAIYAAFAQAAGTTGAIEIVDDNGAKLRLGYTTLKDNGKIHVRGASQRTQGALSAGSAATRTQSALDEIIKNWDLKSPEEIFGDQSHAPRSRSLDGRMATFYDAVSITHPLAWSERFAAALVQLSKITTNKHAEPLRAMIEAAEERQHTLGHRLQSVQEVMTQDVKAAADKSSDIKLADDALDVVHTENMGGGLFGALLESTLEGPTFELPERTQ